MWEYVKVAAMWTGFFMWGLFIYVTLWCTICKINDVRHERDKDRAIQDRIDRIGSL